MSMQHRPGFTALSNGTAQDFAAIEEALVDFDAGLPDRILTMIDRLEDSIEAFPVSRREHVLQSATRALRDDRGADYVVAALVHDLGDDLAPHSHGLLTSAILMPYVEEWLSWVIKVHPVFSQYHYAPHMGGDKHARDRYRDNPWFDRAVEFVEHYDQNCFDPGYDTLPLSTFEPLVREVFTRQPWQRAAPLV
jgi:predicted HD phosphohydrolase